MPPYWLSSNFVSLSRHSRTKASRIFENRGVQDRFLHSDREDGSLFFGITVTISVAHWAGHFETFLVYGKLLAGQQFGTVERI